MADEIENGGREKEQGEGEGEGKGKGEGKGETRFREYPEKQKTSDRGSLSFSNKPVTIAHGGIGNELNDADIIFFKCKSCDLWSNFPRKTINPSHRDV